MNSLLTKRYAFIVHSTQQRLLFKIVCVILFVAAFFTTHAQLRLHAIPKKTVAVSIAKSTARTQSDPPIPLPFWDDFSSYSLDSNRQYLVNSAYWVNSQSVWLNSGMGVNEPTINVVTFDGLDSANVPYNPTQILVNGFTDQLLSKPIDLAVPSTSQDSVYLSFFYQWQGNGEAPDKNDFLLLEFKDNTNKWQEAQKIFPGDTPDRTVFIYSIVKVTSIFQHNNFQFRFRSYGRQSGPFDSWNLDYVYLNKNRTAKDNSFPDRAIASEVPAIFDRYRSVPINHFFYKKTLDSVTFDVQNLKNEATFTQVNYSAMGQVKTYTGGSTTPDIKSITLVKKTTIAKNGGLIEKLGRVKVKLDTLPNPNIFDILATEINFKIKFNLITSGDFEDPLKTRFNGIDFRVNDTVSSLYNLSNYYAYDDGAAEYSVGLTQPGNFAACAFNTLTLDTLTGFDVYFPDFAIANNLSTRFYVFDDNGGQPGSTLRQTTVTIQRNGLNKFKRVAISPTLVPETFYIGWSETSANPIKIGLDMSNDTGDEIFVKVNGAWSQNTIVHGSLMIRPIFGQAGVISGVTEENPSIAGLTESIEIYPNPNSGTFIIKGNYDLIKIINATGQTINYSTEETRDGKQFSLQSAPGLYIIQLQKGSSTDVRKLIIR